MIFNLTGFVIVWHTCSFYFYGVWYNTSAMGNSVIIYTDGACSGNQNRENIGGWGALLINDKKEKEIFGGERNTTNNRMELTACIRGLQVLKQKNTNVELFSDSSYIVNCFNMKWYEKWEKNGWLTSGKKPVENRDLWEKLIELVNRHRVVFNKVKGHSGDEFNERADKLAKRGIEKVK